MKNISAKNIVLRIIMLNRKYYASFTDIYEEAGWFMNKSEFYEELDRLAKCGYIRIKRINSELYIRITRAGIAFFSECA